MNLVNYSVRSLSNTVDIIRALNFFRFIRHWIYIKAINYADNFSS